VALDLSEGQSTFAALKTEVAKQTGNDPSALTLLNEDGIELDTSMIILPCPRAFHFLFTITNQNKEGAFTADVLRTQLEQLQRTGCYQNSSGSWRFPLWADTDELKKSVFITFAEKATKEEVQEMLSQQND
jgi:hypothetical protein